jgi:hypothetical protein
MPSRLPPLPPLLDRPRIIQLPIQPFDPSRPINPEVSLAYLRRIGAVVVAWAKLENSINDLIWVINGKNLATGRFETQDLDLTKLLSALQRAISTNLPGDSFRNDRKSITDIIKVVSDYKVDRNSIVHGTWGRHRGKHGVCSLRFERTSDDAVTIEEFDIARLIAIEQIAVDGVRNCYFLISRLEASRETP